MKTKDLRIEELAKSFGVKEGLGCRPEEKCSECILIDHCHCFRFANMTFDLGYEKESDTKRCSATSILALLKVHAYYPYRPENSPLTERRVVDEDDIETEIKRFMEEKQ